MLIRWRGDLTFSSGADYRSARFCAEKTRRNRFGMAGGAHPWPHGDDAGQPNPPVDCNCLTNLPVFHVNGCIGIVPDLCSIATNCFSSNVVSAPAFASNRRGPIRRCRRHHDHSVQRHRFGTITPRNAPLIRSHRAAGESVAACSSNKTVECGRPGNSILRCLRARVAIRPSPRRCLAR